MFHKLFVVFTALLVIVILILSRLLPAYAQNHTTFHPLDRGFGYNFQYPLETHSVRTSNLTEPEGIDIPFGALVAVEPNDSYLYADGAQPTYLTRIRILAGINAEPVGADVDLTAYLGSAPLLHYNPADAEVEAITLGGQPAVRVSGIPVTPGEGSSEIITAFDGMVYEIVIEAVPVGLGFDTSDRVVLDPTVEAILNSWVFEATTS